MTAAPPATPFIVVHDDAPQARALRGAVRGDRQLRRRSSRAPRRDRRMALARAATLGGAGHRGDVRAASARCAAPGRSGLSPRPAQTSKLRLLSQTGLDGRAGADLRQALLGRCLPRRSSRRILVGRLGVRGATIGFDFHFDISAAARRPTSPSRAWCTTSRSKQRRRSKTRAARFRRRPFAPLLPKAAWSRRPSCSAIRGSCRVPSSRETSVAAISGFRPPNIGSIRTAASSTGSTRCASASAA